MKELLGKGVFTSNELGNARQTEGGSEDFAYISHAVPSIMLAVAAGKKGEGFDYPLHHPKVKFDESALYIGAAAYAKVAQKILAEGGK